MPSTNIERFLSVTRFYLFEPNTALSGSAEISFNLS